MAMQLTFTELQGIRQRYGQVLQEGYLDADSLRAMAARLVLLAEEMERQDHERFGERR